MNDLIGIEVQGVNAEAAGASVWWCGGSAVSVEQLQEALKAAGFEPPAAPSPVAALTRAMRAIVGQRDLSRMLGDEDKRSKGRRAIVEEHRSGDHLNYSVAMRAEVKDGLLVVNADDATDRPNLAARLRDEFEAAQRVFSGADVTSWLVKQLWKLDAVSLRDAGGVYYVPPKGSGAWSRLVPVLREAAGLSLYTMPTMRSGEAAEAIFAAIVRETQDLVVQFAEQTAEGGLGARALRARQDDLRTARAKLDRYESLLARSAVAVHSQLDEVLNALAAAVLIADEAA